MNYSIEKIGPSEADEILSGNTDNRSVSKDHVFFLKSQMIGGQWKQTLDPIKISKSGRLLDGQHRLLALKAAGVELEFLVVRDLGDDVFDVLDTGRKRSAGDVLSIAGYQNWGLLASLAKSIIFYESGDHNSAFRGGGRRINGSKSEGAVTHSAVLEYVRNNDLSQIVLFGKNAYSSGRLLSPREYSLLYYLFSKKSSFQAMEFINKLATGIELSANSPIYLLRRRLEQENGSTAKLDPIVKFALIIRAWNAYRTGVNLGVLKYNREGDFPKIL
jgi:hypothetical protein